MSACTGSLAGATAPVGPGDARVARAEAARRRAGAVTRDYTLTARAQQVDLGGRSAATWSYSSEPMGPVLRGSAGDVLRVRVENQLPTAPETEGGATTSVHWHGLALRNDMDGVPDVTQPPIAVGAVGLYEFTLPHPGTYWYHSHTGVQRDRALLGPLVVDDPDEPGRYDVEFLIVLDDWLDGIAGTPDTTLAMLRAGGMQMDDMTGMGNPAGDPPSAVGADGGDVDYPYYLVNGRVPDAPATLTARPGQRARLRIINAAADTAFRLALGDHQLTVTHTDGFPTVPVTVDALVLGSGERYDALVDLRSGAFPLVAAAEGKQGAGRAVVRTDPRAATPPADAAPAGLQRRLLTYSDLRAAAPAVLEPRAPDRVHPMVLTGDMNGYRWMINGRVFGEHEPLPVRAGERVRLVIENRTTMYHPMHLHGHTFALRDGVAVEGARKDTLNVLPGQTTTVDFEADNPGQWLAHCHLSYHEASGMMTVVSYQD